MNDSRMGVVGIVWSQVPSASLISNGSIDIAKYVSDSDIWIAEDDNRTITRRVRPNSHRSRRRSSSRSIIPRLASRE